MFSTLSCVLTKASLGGGGGQRPSKFQREGRCKIDLHVVSRGPLIQYRFECRSSCSKILSYLHVY